MPSPFPGMNPYLEGNLWTTFHFSFAAEIVRQLVPNLRPKYVALPLERLILDIPEDIAIATSSIYPDVSVATGARETRSVREATVMFAPLRLATVIPERIPQVSIEIRDVKHRQLITSIELLSPTNKRGNGRREYLEKRYQILLSSTHLLEIDLLRRGQRVPMRQPLPTADYFMFLSRAHQRPMTDTWPISLHEPLPQITIPLLPDDPELSLDLQNVFTNTYDTSGYDLAIDYREPPDVPLSDEQAAWSDALLHTAGLRAS